MVRGRPRPQLGLQPVLQGRASVSLANHLIASRLVRSVDGAILFLKCSFGLTRLEQGLSAHPICPEDADIVGGRCHVRFQVRFVGCCFFIWFLSSFVSLADRSAARPCDGVGAASLHYPRTTLGNATYHTDGLRAVLFFVTRPLSVSDVQFLDWVPYLEQRERFQSEESDDAARHAEH